MKEGYFDSHAHYDHELFNGNGPSVVQELFRSGLLCAAVIPAITYESNFNRHLFPAEQFPFIYYAPGLHPKYATNTAFWTKAQRQEFLSVLELPHTVAVKTGLDFKKTTLTDGQKQLQIKFFRLMIEIANEKHLPLVLHIRDAVEEAIAVLTETPPLFGAVTHCFTYDPHTTQRLMNAGVTHFGIGGKVTREENIPLQEAVRLMSWEAILLETDAPFVRPQGITDALNTSANLPLIAQKIAALKNTEITDVMSVTRCNAFRFFGLKETAE